MNSVFVMPVRRSNVPVSSTRQANPTWGSNQESVAETLDGDDESRRRRIALDRFSQSGDVNIDGSCADIGGEAPDVSLQLFTRDELAATFHEIREQLKLPRR